MLHTGHAWTASRWNVAEVAGLDLLRAWAADAGLLHGGLGGAASLAASLMVGAHTLPRRRRKLRDDGSEPRLRERAEGDDWAHAVEGAVPAAMAERLAAAAAARRPNAWQIRI